MTINELKIDIQKIMLNINAIFHSSPAGGICEETSKWQPTELFLPSISQHNSNSCRFPRCIWMLTVRADMLFLAKCNVFNQAGKARVHKFIMQMLVVKKAFPNESHARGRYIWHSIHPPINSVAQLTPCSTVGNFLKAMKTLVKFYLKNVIVTKDSPFIKW